MLVSEINDLRRQVNAEQRKARAKMERLREVNGVRKVEKVSPVRGEKWVAHASTRELRSNLQKLQKFNARSTQFYGDARGNPVSAKTWNEFKREERKLNKWRQDYFDSVKTIKMGNGATVEQASKLRTIRRKITIDDFREPKESSSRSFMSEKKIREQIRRYKKLNREGVEGTAKRARDHFEAMLTTEHYSNGAWVDRVRNLTDEQMLLLWSATDFKKNIATNYEMLRDGLDEYSMGPVSQATENVESLLDWVESKKTVSSLKRRRKNV